MPKSRSATGAAGAPLGAAEARAKFPRKGEAGIERIATSWKSKENNKIVVDKINNSSLLRRARGPPMGRPKR